MALVKKFRLLIILVFIIIWSSATPSMFQKGGVHNIFHVWIVIFSFIQILIFTIPATSIYWPFKIILSLIISSGFLFLATLFMGRILESIYGVNYEVELWKNMPSFLANMIFYSIIIFPGTGMLKLLELFVD